VGTFSARGHKFISVGSSMRKFSNGLLAAAFLIFSLGTAHGAPTPGTLMWAYTTGGYIESSPAIGADGTIYVGSWDSKLHAVNPNGTLKWSYTTGNEILSSPAIGADGTIYVGSLDSTLHAVNPNGTFKWSYATGGSIYSSPAIGADGTIYVGSDDHKLHAINSDGTLKWAYTTGERIESSPAIGADGTIYVGGVDSKLYAINPKGTLKWAYNTRGVGFYYSSPAIGANGTIYVGSLDAKLYAVNPNGSLKWSYTTGNMINSSPAIGADGTIYVGSDGSKLYAINPVGTLKWAYTTGDRIKSSPAIGADGTIYVGSLDHKLHAINTDGTLKWAYTTENQIDLSSPTIGADGTIYVGSGDNKLYAFSSSSPGLVNSSWPMFHHDLKHTGAAPLPTLTVTKSGTGTVTSSPSGIDCGTACTEDYAKGAKVTLTPVPDYGFIFTKWIGDCKGKGKCVTTLSADKSIEAVFDQGYCVYTASPKSKTFTYKGGAISAGITAKGSTSCPAPYISQDGAWIGLTSTFAMTKGKVQLTIPEYDSSIPRTGKVYIGIRVQFNPMEDPQDSISIPRTDTLYQVGTFTVTQDGKPCTLALSASSSDLFSNAGGTGSFTVTATPADCAWTATPAKTSTWLTITSGATGTGTGVVAYTVGSNSGKVARSGKINVVTTLNKKSKPYTVKQSNM
jgi:outer membrane protein assembly factor BamB